MSYLTRLCAFRLCQLIVLVAPVLLLNACGGGGGSSGGSGGTGTGTGGSGGGGGSGSGGATVPLNPPAAPAITFGGNQSSAMFSDASVSALADGIGFGILLGIQLADESTSITLPVGPVIDENFPGPEGGTVHVTGRVDSTGLGWVQYDLAGYTEDGISWTGTQVFERQQLNNGAQDSLTEVRLIDLNVVDAGRNVTVNGSVVNRSSIAPATTNVTGTVLYLDNLRSSEYLIQNFDIVRDKVSVNTEISATGRVYDETYGWADISFFDPWGIVQFGRYPSLGGPVVARNESGDEFRIVTLGPEIVSLQYASAGGTTMDRGARLVWPIPFSLQTSSMSTGSPLADAGASTYMPSGTTLSLNAAFSGHSESQFLSYQWELLFRPPGSQAVLDSAVAVQPHITLDELGRYLLRLTVSDGSRSDQNYVVLTADDGTSQQSYAGYLQLPPDSTATVGSSVIVNKRLGTLPDLQATGTGLYVAAIGPLGDTIGVSQDDNSAVFSVTEPGQYMVVGSAADLSSSGIRPRDFQAISADVDYPFAPMVSFPVAADPGPVAMADLNGDGRSDLIVSHSLGGGAGEIHLFVSANQTFQPPQVLSGGDGGPIVVADVSSDGIPDIVTSKFSAISVFEGLSGGGFGSEIEYAGECLSGKAARPIVVADVNNDGRDDVAVTGTCSGLEVFLQQPDGSLGTVQTIATGDRNANLAAGDLNGDARVDLVVGTQGTSFSGNLAIYYGQPNSIPSSPQYLSPAVRNRYAPGVLVTDLDGDGRDDLVFSSNDSLATPDDLKLHIYHQATDGTLTESQALDIPYEVLDLRLMDVDHDGRPDLIPSALAYGLLVHHQQPDGTFLAAPSRYAQYLEMAPRVPPEATGDVNGDGLADLAYTNSGTEVRILFGEP